MIYKDDFSPIRLVKHWFIALAVVAATAVVVLFVETDNTQLGTQLLTEQFLDHEVLLTANRVEASRGAYIEVRLESNRLDECDTQCVQSLILYEQGREVLRCESSACSTRLHKESTTSLEYLAVAEARMPSRGKILRAESQLLTLVWK